MGIIGRFERASQTFVGVWTPQSRRGSRAIMHRLSGRPVGRPPVLTGRTPAPPDTCPCRRRFLPPVRQDLAACPPFRVPPEPEPSYGAHTGDRARGRRRRAPVPADERPRQAGGLLRRAVTASSISRSATASTPGCAASSSPRSTSRSRSTGTSGWAGASSRKSSASSSRSCRRRSASASTGIRAPPTPSTRTSTRSCARSPQHVIVLSGDHVYKMDYAKMLRFHMERGAAVTLAAIEVPIAGRAPLRHRRRSTSSDEVTGFLEKPKHAADDSRLARSGARLDGHLHLRHRRAAAGARGRRGADRRATTSARTSSRRSSRELPTFAYRFYDENKKASKYWRDIGTLDALLRRQHGSLPASNPEFNLYDPGVAAAHLSAAGAAGEVRVRRRGPALRRRRSTRSSRRAASSRAAASTAACSARTCACTASASSSSAS